MLPTAVFLTNGNHQNLSSENISSSYKKLPAFCHSTLNIGKERNVPFSFCDNPKNTPLATAPAQRTEVFETSEKLSGAFRHRWRASACEYTKVTIVMSLQNPARNITRIDINGTMAATE